MAYFYGGLPTKREDDKSVCFSPLCVWWGGTPPGNLGRNNALLCLLYTNNIKTNVTMLVLRRYLIIVTGVQRLMLWGVDPEVLMELAQNS